LPEQSNCSYKYKCPYCGGEHATIDCHLTFGPTKKDIEHQAEVAALRQELLERAEALDEAWEMLYHIADTVEAAE
jgi:hypothetical protein